jgi:hypothetical protein
VNDKSALYDIRPKVVSQFSTIPQISTNLRISTSRDCLCKGDGESGRLLSRVSREIGHEILQAKNKKGKT